MLEACETDGLHAHLVLKFRQIVDKTARSFAFEGLVPNVQVGDYLGEGVNGKRQQQAVNRGFFYVFADKVGTQREADGTPCFEGNHVPVWVKAKKGQSRYAVLGKWCENLWKARKLCHDTYEEYLYQTRDGVLSRKRSLDEVKGWEERREEKQAREAVTARVRATLFNPSRRSQQLKLGFHFSPRSLTATPSLWFWLLPGLAKRSGRSHSSKRRWSYKLATWSTSRTGSESFGASSTMASCSMT